MQVRAPSNREAKVLTLGDEVKMFLGFKHHTTGKAWSSSDEDIIAFCKKVLLNLKAKIPETMDDFLLRLDMFEVDGKLKLNEVEYFDVQYLPSTKFTIIVEQKYYYHNHSTTSERYS